MNIPDKHKELLRHMLGADSRYRKKQWGFRNHYCADDNLECPDRKELDKMELVGLVKSGERLGMKTYWATKAGAIAIGFKAYQLSKTRLAV